MLGKTTPEGFMPSEPRLDDMLKSIGLTAKEGWDELNNMPSSAFRASPGHHFDELAEAFVAVYSTPQGEKMFEALLDKTLRRVGPFPTGQNLNFEQLAAHGLFAQGQRDIVIWMLAMVERGRESRRKKSEQQAKA